MSNYDPKPKENLLYEQLLGSYYALPDGSSHISRTGHEDHWLALNKVMDELVSLGHKDYGHFKVTPTHHNYNGSSHTEVNIVALKMKMMQALRRMSAEFDCGNPAYDLSRYTNPSGFSVSQITHSANNSSSYQTQEQSQEIHLNIHEVINKTLDYIKINYTEEKINEASEILEPLKKGDCTWPKLKKAIDFFANLSREAFFAFAPVLFQLSLQAQTTPHR